MYKLISSIFIFFSICQFSIGIWEAIVTGRNEPNSTNTTNTIQSYSENQEIYVFVITKACCNIFSAISLFFTGIALYYIENDFRSDRSDNSKNVLFQLICLGTSIWGLVRYLYKPFADKLIDPYKNVLLVEMIYFFSIIGLFVIAICITCSCLFINRSSDVSQSTNKQNIITDLDRKYERINSDDNCIEYHQTKFKNVNINKQLGIGGTT
jgi:hypothetical protein